MNKKQYISALKISKDILKDTKRKISKQQALVKAAETVGINPKEFLSILNKRTIKI